MVVLWEYTRLLDPGERRDECEGSNREWAPLICIINDALMAKSVTIADPFFAAAGKHFDSLFERYGTPLIVLNPIKVCRSYFKGLSPLTCPLPGREPREAKLPFEYSQCVDYLSQKARSYSIVHGVCHKHTKSPSLLIFVHVADRWLFRKTQDVISYLEDIAEEAIQLTGFFHSGPEPYSHKLKSIGE